MTEENNQPQGEPSEQQPVQPPVQEAAPAPTQPVQPAQPVQPTQPVQPPVGQPTQPVQPPAGQPQQSQQPYAVQPQQPYGQSQPVAAQNQPGSGKALGALICGIFAIVFSGTVLVGVVLGIIAIVLASQYVKAFGKDGKATGGKVCGIVGIVFSVISLFLWISVGALVGAAINEYEPYEPSSSSSSIESIIAESVDSDALEAEVEAAAVKVIDGMSKLDSDELKAIYSELEEAFESSSGMTLAEVGIDFDEAISKTAGSITYEIDDVFVYSNGEEATVYADVTSIDLETIFMNWLEKLLDLGTDATLDQVEGTFTSAIAESKATNKSIMLDFTKVGNTWEVDQDDYESELEYVYGL